MPKEWMSHLHRQQKYIAKHFSKETQQRFEQVVAHASVPNNNLNELVAFVKEYDLRRKKSFIKVFPEYEFITQQL